MQHNLEITLVDQFCEKLEVPKFQLRAGGIVCRILPADTTYQHSIQNDDYVTVVTFHSIQLEGPPESLLTDDLLMYMLNMAVDGKGCDVMADIETENLFKPNKPIRNLRLLTELGAVELESRHEIPTRPITSFMAFKPEHRDLVASHITGLINDAVKEYSERDEMHTRYTQAQYITEYLLQHGAWLNLNHDATLTQEVR